MASAIQLTDEEEQVLEALRLIEPEIEAFRPVAPRRIFDDADRDSIIVRRRGLKEPLPIGCLGDGIWRVLGLALGLASSAGGALLVDEIDTGLHYSVMVDAWRMVQRASERLGVQIFATTHSRDCVEALAALSEELGTDQEHISIQRIERGQSVSTAYTQAEIVAAASRGIELR